MLKGKSKQKAHPRVNQPIKRQKVTFSFETRIAKDVILVGDFNAWNPKIHPMKMNKIGIWNKAVMIPPGRYEYKFLVDGNWALDPRNDQSSPNCFGTLNSVLQVAPK
jgi:1,4-alpha-glucan branching enzyme